MAEYLRPSTPPLTWTPLRKVSLCRLSSWVSGLTGEWCRRHGSTCVYPAAYDENVVKHVMPYNSEAIVLVYCCWRSCTLHGVFNNSTTSHRSGQKQSKRNNDEVARWRLSSNSYRHLAACCSHTFRCFSYRAKKYATLVEKAVFVSGRDTGSIDAFSNLLRKSKGPVVQPEDVALVRDPVLSDKMLTDTKGTCWKQSEGVRRV